MGFSFAGKKILVTGAGRGIGRGLAIALSQSGGRVFALSRTQSTLDTLVNEYPSVTPITLDVSKWQETRNVLEKLETMDCLVNNAGTNDALYPGLDCPREQIDKIINTNLMSAINCIQVIGKKMVTDRRKGSIVNVSSIFSNYAFPNFLAYNLTKAAMDSVTKQFALELGPHNIRVNSVNTTVIKTDLVKNLGTIVEEFVKQTPIGRVGEISEAVQPIMYLLSDHASMVSGICHVIDGGLLCKVTL